MQNFSFAVKKKHGCWESLKFIKKKKGAFGFLLGEKEDGIDTIKWVSKQKWCNGKIGVWGISYVGYAAWATASGLQELINSGGEFYL